MSTSTPISIILKYFDRDNLDNGIYFTLFYD